MPRSALPTGFCLLLASVAAAIPARGATWRPLGPAGGTVTTLAVGLDGSLLGGTEHAGLFLRRAGASTWTATAPGPLPPFSAAQISGDGSIYVIAVGGEPWRSRDRGLTWQSLRPALAEAGAPPFALSLESAASAPEELVALLGTEAAGTPVFFSHDGGDSWEPASPPPDKVVQGRLWFDPNERDRLFAVASTGLALLVTEDRGASWQAIAPGLAIQQLALERGARGRIYAWSWAGDPRRPAGSIYTSLDHGRTFERRAALAAVTYLTADPQVPGALYAVDALGRVHYSRDAGRSFRIQGALPRLPAVAFAADPSRAGALYAAVPGGPLGRSVLCSRNRAATWTPCVYGFLAADVLTLAASADGGTWWVGFGAIGSVSAASHSGLWALDAAGWRPRAFAPVAVRTLSPHPVLAEDVVAGTLGAGLQRTTDGGASWKRLSPPGDTFTAVDRDPTEPRHLLARSERGVWTSRDGGETWLPLAHLHVGPHLRFAPDGTAFYASLAPGEGLDGGGDVDALARFSADGSSKSNLLAGDGRIQAIAVDSGTNDRLWVAWSGHRGGQPFGLLRHSVDGGKRWQAIAFPGAPIVTAIALEPGTTRGVLVGTGSGVYRSLDDGAHWARFGDGLPPGIWISSLVLGADGQWRAATRGAGVFGLTEEP